MKLKRLASITGKDVDALLSALAEKNIEPRREIRQIVEAYVNACRTAKEMVTLFVIGEWGEGKTSIYNGYLKTLAKDFKLIDISAKRVIDGIRELNEKRRAGTSRAAVLLASILNAISALTLEGGKEEVPPYKGEDVVEYAKKALDTLFKDNRKVIVFIDEFEEIVAPVNKDIITDMVHGLVELINGEFPYLNERYPGMLHLALAMTPYAYSRILSIAGIDESLKGRAERRLFFKIELRPLTRVEAFALSGSLIEYMLERRELPFPKEFLSTTYLASQGNPGALTALLDSVLSALTKGGCVQKTSDPVKLTSILSEITVFTYVGSARALDPLYLRRVLLGLAGNEEEEKVIYTLAAFAEPLTAEELKRLGNIKADVEVLLERLDQNSQISLRKPLIETYLKIKYPQSLKAYEVVSQALRELFPSIDQNSLREVLEELTYPEDPWSERYSFVIPFNAETLEEILSKRKVVGQVKNLPSLLKKRLEGAGIKFEIAYSLSRHHAVSLYPPPAVAAIDFVKDTSFRAKAWRDALNALLRGEVDITRALVDMMKYVFNARIQGQRALVPRNYGGKKVEIPVMIVPLLVLNEEKVNAILSSAKRYGTQLLIIVTRSEIAENVKSMVGDEAEVVALKDTRLIQLATYTLMLQKHPTMVDQGRAIMRLKEIAEEMEIEKLIEKWFKLALNEGIIITDLPRSSGASEETLVDAYSYYLAYPRDEMTTEDVFNHVIKNVKRFIIYGRGSRRKVPFISGLDVESVAGLKRYEDDLVKIGLLERVDGTLRISLTNVEKRILNILREKNVESIRNLSSKFIIVANNPRLLTDFYLKILERRGLVKVISKGGEPQAVELVDLSKRKREAEEQWKQLSEYWNSLGHKWNSYAHIVVSKKKDDNIIFLKDIANYITSIMSELRGVGTREARLSSFIIALTNYAKEALTPVTVEAYKAGEKLVREAYKRRDSLIEDAERIINEVSRKLKIPLPTANDMEEIRRINNKVKEFVELSEKKLRREEIEEIVYEMRKRKELPDLFYFELYYDRRMWPKADYFNIKYHILRKNFETLNEEFNTLSSMLNEIRRLMREYEEKSKKLTEQLEKLASGKGGEISRALYSVMKSVLIRGPEVEAEWIFSFADLLKYLSKVVSNVGMFDERVTRAIRALTRITDKEAELRLVINTFKMKERVLSAFYAETPLIHDIIKEEEILEEFDEKVEELVNKVKQIESLEELVNVAEEVGRELDEWRRKIEKSIERLEESHKSSLNSLRRLLDRIDKMVNLISKVENVSDVKNKILKIRMELKELERSKLVDTSITYKKLSDEIEKINAYVKTLMRELLTPDELTLIQIISNRGSIKLKELLEEAKKSGLDEEKALRSVISLEQKGLVEGTISLK